MSFDYGEFSFASKEEVLEKSREFWNPGKTDFWVESGRAAGHRPARGLLHLRHVGQAAARRAPQRRHLQPRAPQPRGRRRGRLGDVALRHRQPPLPRPDAHRARRGAGRRPAPPGLTKVVYGSGGGEAIDIALKTARHTTQRRKIVSIVKAYHGHTGLAVATGDERFSKLFLADRPDEFVHVPFNDLDGDGGGAARPRRRRRDHGDHPGDVRLPAAGARLPRGRQAAVRAATARSTSPTRCRPG